MDDDDDLCGIPRAMAFYYRQVGAQYGVDFEELESVANLAFATALRSFDPAKSHNGNAGLKPFVLQGVRLQLMKEIWPPKSHPARRMYQRRVSLDQNIRGSDDTLVPLFGRLEPGFAQYDDADEAAHLLSALPPRERETMVLTAQGYTLSEIGERLGVSHQRSGEILASARRRIAMHLVNFFGRAVESVR